MAANTEMMNNNGVTINKNEMGRGTSMLTQEDILYIRAYNDAMEDYWLHGRQPQRPSYLPKENPKPLTHRDKQLLRAHDDAMEDYWLRGIKNPAKPAYLE